MSASAHTIFSTLANYTRERRSPCTIYNAINDPADFQSDVQESAFMSLAAWDVLGIIRSITITFLDSS